MIENPNFTSMTKANIAAWAKEHLGIDIDTGQTKDAMIVLAETALADRNAGAPPPEHPAPGEQAANTEEAPQEGESAPTSPMPAAPDMDGGLMVVVNAHRTSTVPLSVNGRLCATLTVGEPALITPALLSVMNDSGLNYTIL